MRNRERGVSLNIVALVGCLAVQTNAAEFAREEVIIPAGRFEEGAISTFCKERLRGSMPPFLDLWFFRSRREASTFRGGATPLHLDYTSWRNRFDAVQSARIPVAELVVINSSAVLLFRGEDGKLRRNVLSGRDPLLLDFGGTDVHLCYFAIVLPTAGQRESRVEVYAQANRELTEDFGTGLLLALRAILPFRRLAVAVRNDFWFIDNPFYPPWVTTASGPPPTAEEFNASKTLSCGSDPKGRTRCAIFTQH